MEEAAPSRGCWIRGMERGVGVAWNRGVDWRCEGRTALELKDEGVRKIPGIGARAYSFKHTGTLAIHTIHTILCRG